MICKGFCLAKGASAFFISPCIHMSIHMSLVAGAHHITSPSLYGVREGEERRLACPSMPHSIHFQYNPYNQRSRGSKGTSAYSSRLRCARELRLKSSFKFPCPGYRVFFHFFLSFSSILHPLLLVMLLLSFPMARSNRCLTGSGSQCLPNVRCMSSEVSCAYASLASAFRLFVSSFPFASSGALTARCSLVQTLLPLLLKRKGLSLTLSGQVSLAVAVAVSETLSERKREGDLHLTASCTLHRATLWIQLFPSLRSYSYSFFFSWPPSPSSSFSSRLRFLFLIAFALFAFRFFLPFHWSHLSFPPFTVTFISLFSLFAFLSSSLLLLL